MIAGPCASLLNIRGVCVTLCERSDLRGIFMVDTVVCELVSVIDHLLHDRREVESSVRGDEKSAFDLAFVEQVEEPPCSNRPELATGQQPRRRAGAVEVVPQRQPIKVIGQHDLRVQPSNILGEGVCYTSKLSPSSISMINNLPTMQMRQSVSQSVNRTSDALPASWQAALSAESSSLWLSSSSSSRHQNPFWVTAPVFVPCNGTPGPVPNCALVATHCYTHLRAAAKPLGFPDVGQPTGRL